MNDHLRSAASAIPESAFIAPPALITAISVAGVSLQDWVYIFTIIWSLLGITHHIWTKWIVPFRDRRSLAAKMGLPKE